MSDAPSPGSALANVAPKLGELTDTLVFGDIWERPGLSKRDRSLITVAALVSLNRKEVASHMRRAVANGVTKDELVEALTHLAIYAGFPAAVSAALTLEELDL